MDQFYQNPPTYELLCDKVQQMKNTYPHMRNFSIGKSVLGRKIFALGIGNLKNATLFVAAIHAQEWLTCMLVTHFLEDLCYHEQNQKPLFDTNLTDMFAERGLIVVPMANPDGVEIALNGAASAKHLRRQVDRMLTASTRSWQANARGIDLNHNFNAGFQELKAMERAAGITRPCERQFGGYTPQSEPETRALVHLCLGLNIKKLLAFHSQGEEIYYSYGPNTPKNAKMIADALKASSGYQVMNPTGLASHGGLKDWFINHTHRNGFTIEIGKGENPLPISDLPGIYHKLREMMFISLLI
ncbi:M14 family zinc carboxypeptidase [Massilioclostridium coli]|uniref:M14 family zinc carboxypeptidase n=1 Tax=Massilioclostridium coli TaxID=1870991 RepID=UPI00085C1769|nr:M14 family zinc carboxypeptidase [Massilioclostridium coli]